MIDGHKGCEIGSEEKDKWKWRELIKIFIGQRSWIMMMRHLLTGVQISDNDYNLIITKYNFKTCWFMF